MITIEGYSIKELLYQGAHYTVHRAIRDADGQRVILKICRLEQPNLVDLAGLQHEYQLLSTLRLPGVIRAYDLIIHHQQFVLVLEDIQGQSLYQYCNQQPLPFENFFIIALQLIDILSGLHLQHIIHKDINPNNIIIEPNSLKIQLADFNISSQLNEESTEHLAIHRLEGSLAYISPEQTGRMNRPIDYRSDFYSLGITFFELLTGQPPFVDSDPLKMVHHHIAVTPPLTHELNPSVPAQLSLLVAKLLAKVSEERYASASGIKADLLKCQFQWAAQEHIDHFPLGLHDIHDRLTLSHKLYGRGNQTTQLLDTFQEVMQGNTALALVSGYSGIGKTSVVKEIQKPLISQNAYFISGKFDQLQRAKPYSAFVVAFQTLVKQILSESEERLLQFKEALVQALGSNGKVVTDLIPNLALIIGVQPSVPELPPLETQNRFIITFQNFIRALSQPQHPLVIFLDDLQWIDNASLEIIKSLLMDPDLHYLLFIGAYRDNEVTPDHPFSLTLEQLKKNTKITEVALTPLTLANIQELLADSFNCPILRVEELAKLVLTKTQGNPFFINEFLKLLYRDHLVKFSHELGQWDWDVQAIEQQQITDNVVNLLISRISQLTEEIQHILKLAACIGYHFDIETLRLISQSTLPTLLKSLWIAIQEGLIIPQEKSYKELQVLEKSSMSTKVALKDFSYRFAHDRIQQACYQLIPEEARRHFHLQVGCLLLQEYLEEENEERLFMLLDHCNQSIDLIEEKAKKLQLAELNLHAGCKAKTSTAYLSAKNYLQAGLTLLAPLDWDKQHHLIFSLYKELASCQYLSGEFSEVKTIFKELIHRAPSLCSKLELYKLNCEMLATLNQHEQAISVGLDGLKLLKIHLHPHPSMLQILSAIAKVKLKTGFSSISGIVMPKMMDPDYEAAASLISQLFNSAYIIEHNLFVLLVAELVRLSLKHGYTEATSFACVVYAFIIMHALNWYKEGIAFSDLYHNLKHQYGVTALEGRSYFVLGSFVEPWRMDLTKCLEAIATGYQLTYEKGDLLYSNYGNLLATQISLAIGNSLADADTHVKSMQHLIERMKIKDFRISADFFNYKIQCLMGKKKFDANLIGNYEKTILNDKNKTQVGFFYCASIKLCYLFGAYAEARELGRKCLKHMQNILGFVLTLEGLFYYALSLTADFHKGDLKTLKSIRKKFKRWAGWCAINYQAYLCLLEAEIAKVQGKIFIANNLYDEAIQLADEKNLLSLAALASECATRLYREFGKSIIARGYLQNAYYCYQRWGAEGKCQLLVQQYPQWLQNVSLRMGGSQGDTVENIQADIDVLSLFRFSQTVSSEIQLDILLKKLLIVLLQNAGAQRAVLIVKNSDQWFLEAEGSSAEQRVYLNHTQPLSARSDLPLKLLNYAERTQDTVIIQHENDVVNMSIEDAYLNEVKPRSLLIIPISHQGQLKNFLYLENRIVHYAFPVERVQTLKMMASQAAVSLENARLYYQVAHDPLTGLANRNLLYQTFEMATKLRGKIQMAILFMDLDGFKKINDTLGHEIGDKLLQYFANQLKLCSREGDLAARLGGDEFVLMINDAKDVQQIVKLAERLLQILNEHIFIDRHEIFITSSIGISLYPENGTSIQELLKHADVALYQVKSQGKGHYQFFSEEINQRLFLSNQQEIELREALEHHQFRVYYQPIFSAHDQQVNYLEALVRWQHPTKGLRKAKDFIPLAEKSGLIIPLGDWVLNEVCSQLKAWQTQGLPMVPVAINISGLQFKKQSISEEIKNLLETYQLDPWLLQLEITESVFLESSEQIASDLQALKKIGIKLAIDDFGTYYASFNYLKQFAIHAIKIDYSFVKDIDYDSQSRAIIQAMIALGHHLHLKVIAEGVETEQQMRFLQENAVDAIQGYYLSRPIDAAACGALLVQQFQK